MLAMWSETSPLESRNYLLRGQAGETLHSAGALIWTNASAERVSSGIGSLSSARDERQSSTAS